MRLRLVVWVVGVLCAVAVPPAVWFAPWSTVLGVSSFSTDSGSHGVLIAALADIGLVGLVASLPKRRWWGAALAIMAGAAGVAVALYDRHAILHPSSHGQLAELANSMLLAFQAIHIGWGLYVALGGSLGIALAGLALLAVERHAPATPPAEGIQAKVARKLLREGTAAFVGAAVAMTFVIGLILGTSFAFNLLTAVQAAALVQAAWYWPHAKPRRPMEMNRVLLWLVLHPAALGACIAVGGVGLTVALSWSQPEQIVFISLVWVGFGAVFWWVFRRAIARLRATAPSHETAADGHSS